MRILWIRTRCLPVFTQFSTRCSERMKQWTCGLWKFRSRTVSPPGVTASQFWDWPFSDTIFSYAIARRAVWIEPSGACRNNSQCRRQVVLSMSLGRSGWTVCRYKQSVFIKIPTNQDSNFPHYLVRILATDAAARIQGECRVLCARQYWRRINKSRTIKVEYTDNYIAR